jgi:hypothetical protein
MIQIQIGDFLIRRLGNGLYWIEDENGSGFECTPEALEAVIYEFFEVNVE